MNIVLRVRASKILQVVCEAGGLAGGNAEQIEDASFTAAGCEYSSRELDAFADPELDADTRLIKHRQARVRNAVTELLINLRDLTPEDIDLCLR